MKKFNKRQFHKFIIEHNIVGFFKQPIKLKSGRLSNWYVNWRNVSEDVYLIDELSDYVLAFAYDLGLYPDCFYGVPEGATKLGIITQYKFDPDGVILTEMEGKFSAVSISWINKISENILKEIDDMDIDCVYGDPNSICREIGIITQYNLAKQSERYGKGIHCLPMGRKKPKSHGDPKDRYFVGKPSGRTLVLLENKEREEQILKPIDILDDVEVCEVIYIEEQPVYAKLPEEVVVLEDVTTTGSSLLSTIDVLLKKDISVIASIGLTNRNELRDDGKSVKEAIEEREVPYYAMSNALELLPEIYQRQKPGEEIAKLVEDYFKKYGVKDIKLIRT